MATSHFIYGIICLVSLIGNRLPNSNLLNTPAQEKILRIAKSQLEVRETKRNNFGPEIKSYLSYTNLPEGNPYCASFISWVFYTAGYNEPRTAWSPDLFPVNKRIISPQPADLLGINSDIKQRIVHCGIVERLYHNWIISIEGNTNNDGSSDGNGNYRKWRHKKTIKYFSRWLKKEEVLHE